MSQALVNVTGRENANRQTAGAACASIACNEKARRPIDIDLRACGGVGARKSIVSGREPARCGPGAPGQLESQGPLPSPDSSRRAARGDLEGTWGSVAGDSASRLGRQAAAPIMQQRTSLLSRGN